MTDHDDRLLAEHAATLGRLRRLHSERVYQPRGGEGGYSWSLCGECGQGWPCQTVKVMNGAE